MSLQTSLHDQHCKPVTGRMPMTPAEIEQHLALLQGWTFLAPFITKMFVFSNYYETMAFVNALAWICHQQDHHPDLEVTYNRCTVKLNTHSVQGISINDFIVAAKADHLSVAPTAST
jgi:4a-hydroxytetrahydrobiopterin dehydratase